MFNLLAKRFIKNGEQRSESDLRLSYISLSSIVGVGINIILFIIKISLGLFVGSQAIINDAFNNLSDSLASLMALFGSNISKKPADRNHPFGHGRSEYLISLLVSIIIMYVGFSLFIKSIGAFGEKSGVDLSTLSLAILAFSILFKVYIFFLNKSLYKKFSSDLNKGVMLDARNDILATLSIIGGFFLQKYLSFNIDAMIGLILALFVFKPGVDMFIETSKILIGKRVDPLIEDEIGKIIMEGRFIRGYHDLQIHEYGKGKMAGSCHVEVPANLTVEEVHKAIDDVEEKVFEKTKVELSIHMDPTYCLVD
ncbi:MAG: cation diffusion facilitator family transporter [Anaerococcus sp.]|nr:cation diffusion facilitator family transporter [Anaerococcus sp.]